jgi:hypothetical protein
VAFLGPRENAELVPKFHIALHASYAALPMVTSKFRPTVALPMSDKNFTSNVPKLCPLSKIPYQKDEQALLGNLQNW